MKRLIIVWCEYDIGGPVSSYERVFYVADDTDSVDRKVLDYLTSVTGLGEEELEDLYDWNFLEPSEL